VVANDEQKLVVDCVHVLQLKVDIALAQFGVMVLKLQSASEFTVHSAGLHDVKPSQDAVE